MISFIIDGFDPWENVEKLLELVHEEISEDYEVILISSFLLDTPFDICNDKGKELFGRAFTFIRNDSASLFHARLRAQEAASGNRFVYLSPLVLPQRGCLANLLSHLSRRTEFSCFYPPLFFACRSGAERFLACGYAVSEDGQLVPALMGRKELVAKESFFDGLSPAPYCFCSNGPFYAKEDLRENFWRTHIEASEKFKSRCVAFDSQGITLYPEAFSFYYQAVSQKFTGKERLRDVSARNKFSVWLSPYARFRMSCSCGDGDAPAGAICEDDIFWKLLVNQLPEFIAEASRGNPAPSLRFLAHETLLEISSKTWSRTRNKASHLLENPATGWQTFVEWLNRWEPESGHIYASETPSLRQAMKESSNLPVAVSNLFHIVKNGLFGR